VNRQIEKRALGFAKLFSNSTPGRVQTLCRRSQSGGMVQSIESRHAAEKPDDELYTKTASDEPAADAAAIHLPEERTMPATISPADPSRGFQAGPVLSWVLPRTHDEMSGS
jgi:hypothetical protein